MLNYASTRTHHIQCFRVERNYGGIHSFFSKRCMITFFIFIELLIHLEQHLDSFSNYILIMNTMAKKKVAFPVKMHNIFVNRKTVNQDLARMLR